MTRSVRMVFAILAVGCSGQPERGAGTPSTRRDDPAPGAPAEEAPEPRATDGPFLTPEAAPDLTMQPVPAGHRASRDRTSDSYKLNAGPASPLPVLPARKPVRILGDLRFLAAGPWDVGIALSPDGKRLAFGTRIFDALTGEVDAAYDPASNAVYKLTFSPDGTRLYCGAGPITAPSHGDTLSVRDVPGRQQLLTIKVSDWCLSRDGRILVTLESQDYDPDAGKPGIHPDVAYSYIVVRLYDTKTWKGVAAFRAHGFPTAVALSPDGGQIVVGCDDGSVRVWDRAASREVAVLRDLCEAPFPICTPVVHLFAFSPDGKALAAANARHDHATPRKVVWWQWPDCRLLHVRPTADSVDPSDLQFTPDGKHLFCGRRTGATVWDAQTGEVCTDMNRTRDKRAVPALTFAAGGRAFAGGGLRPVLLTSPSLDPVPWPDRPFDDHPKVPFELAGPIPSSDTRVGRNAEVLLPDGSRLRTYTRNNPDWGVQLVGPDGQVVRHFEKGRVVEFDVTPDGKLLAAYGHPTNGQGYDHPLRFWDVATGTEVAEIRVHPQPNYAMRFSPDGRRLAVLHSDGQVRLWDVATRKPVMALDGGAARLTFSKDGKWLVGGAAESPVLVVWDVAEVGR